MEFAVAGQVEVVVAVLSVAKKAIKVSNARSQRKENMEKIMVIQAIISAKNVYAISVEKKVILLILVRVPSQLQLEVLTCQDQVSLSRENKMSKKKPLLKNLNRMTRNLILVGTWRLKQKMRKNRKNKMAKTQKNLLKQDWPKHIKPDREL